MEWGPLLEQKGRRGKGREPLTILMRLIFNYFLILKCWCSHVDTSELLLVLSRFPLFSTCTVSAISYDVHHCIAEPAEPTYEMKYFPRIVCLIFAFSTMTERYHVVLYTACFVKFITMHSTLHSRVEKLNTGKK